MFCELIRAENAPSELLCKVGDKYLKNADDILQFEATSKEALDATLDVLDSDKFKEKYEFSQDSETLFSIRLRLLDILD